jgi:DNA-binding beta-propeller fold protein YncE
VLAHRVVGLIFAAACSLGCSSEPLDGEGPGEPQAPPAQTIALTLVYEPKAKVELSATSLAFNPRVEGELWVALRQFPSGRACNQDDTDAEACSALQGAMGVVSDATSATPSAVIKQDGNAWHFMRRPTQLAWGEGLLFASCGEALTDNYEDGTDPYAGPVLWSSDPAIFGVEPLPDQNGTHLDMLHETPYCMGIAHESGNAYWTFNGDAGALDRVDFHVPHQIGGEDHDDGEVHRYVAGQLLRVPEVPSHLAYDPRRKLVYVADTGHGRVLAIDPSTAMPAGAIDVYEVLQASGRMDGATVRELVPPGLLQMPSGLALSDDALYVTDNATSLVYRFDMAGKAQAVLDTSLPHGALAGLTLGPDRRLYLTDLLSGAVLRAEIPPN